MNSTEKIVIINRINEILGEAHAMISVSYEQIWKNNEMREGLSIRGKKDLVGIIFYPDELWWQIPVRQLAFELNDIYMEKRISVDKTAVSNLINRNYILSAVKPRLVSKTNVSDLQKKEIAFKTFIADLVVVFAVDVDVEGMEEGASVKLTEQMLNFAGVGLDELYQQAVKNVRKYSFVSMREMLADMLGDEETLTDTYPCYILTNSQKIHGAAVIINKDVLDEVAKKVQDDFYLLPSSVHEMLVLPKSQAPEEVELLAMVKEANREVVEKEDRLCDNVYLYTVKKGLIARY